MASDGKDLKKASPNYILRVASHILSLNLVEEKLPNPQALHSFCEQTTPLLVISRLDTKGHVDVTNSMSFDGRPAVNRVVFYKSRASPLVTDTDFKANVSVLTMGGSATDAFLGSLQQVFSKLHYPNSSHSQRLSELVNELEGSLAATRGDEGGVGSEIGSKRARMGSATTAIDTPSFTLDEELSHWKRQAAGGKEPGTAYNEALEPLADALLAISNGPLGQVDDLYELVEAAEDSVDALWNCIDEPYPQSRMRTLLSAIAVRLGDVLATRLGPVMEQVWRSREAKEAVRAGLGIVNQWLEAVGTATGRSWAGNALHQW